MGVTRRKRQMRRHAAASPRLHALTLATPAITENTAAGTLVSAILGTTAGSLLALIDDAGGRFALASGAIVTGVVALDRETADSHTIALRETLAGYADSPRDTVLTIAVRNVFESPDLGELSLSRTEFAVGIPAEGAIVGATAGSTITAAGLPAGLAIDGAARTASWDGAGPASTGALLLTESHPDAANSPRTTTIDWAVVEAPGVAISDEFPTLKAAYESGQRALICWVGDSTVANAGGLAEENSSAWYLRRYLADAGLAGVVGGCFSSGDKGLTLTGMSVARYGQFYDPDATFAASFTWYALENTAFGLRQAYSTVVGDRVRYDPGMVYDRLELFYPTFPGAGTFDLEIGATRIAGFDGNQATSYRRTAAFTVARGDAPVDQVITGGTAWPGTVRVWDSTASRTLQVENLGVCGYRCSDWLATSGTQGPGMAAGNQIAILGAHLVIIQLGVNEMNTGVDAATYQANLTALVTAFKAAGSDVLVCLPPPAMGGYAMDADHRAAVPAACTAAGIGAPVDLYSGIGLDVTADLVDAVHPNAAGNYKIVNGAGGIGPRILNHA
jgi:hypothetical protein